MTKTNAERQKRFREKQSKTHKLLQLWIPRPLYDMAVKINKILFNAGVR